MGMVFCDTLDEFINNDAYEIFALCYVLYANIMISYGFAIQIAKWKKQKLNTLHYVISFTGLIIAGTISLILKSILTRDLDDLLALFPLELFPVMLDNNQEKGCLIFYRPFSVVAKLIYLKLHGIQIC